MSRRATRRDRERVYQSQSQAIVPASLFQQVLALSAGKPIFTADYYAVDGVSGKMAALIDWNDPTHTLSQAVSANQAALPAGNASFGGQLCVSMVGDFQYVSNRSAVYWGTLQGTVPNYTFDTYACSAAVNQIVWETGNGSELPAATSHYILAGNPSHVDMRPRASPTVVTMVFRGGLVLNVAVVARTRRTATTIYLRSTGGGNEISGALAASPDGSAAPRPLTIGRTGVTAGGRLRHLMWFPDLTQPQLLLIDQYFFVDSGIVPAPLLDVLAIAAGKPVFTADYYAVDGVSGKVAGFIDYNDPSHLLAQATSALQVAVPAGHADFGGSLCATFTGAETYVSNQPSSRFEFMSDGSGLSQFFCFSPTSVVTTQSFACTTSGAGVRGMSFYASVTAVRSSCEKTGTSVYPDSSVGSIAAGTGTYRELSHGTARSPQYDLRSKSTTTASGSYASPAEAGAPMHTLRLGSNAGPSLFFTGRWRDLILTPGVTPAQRTTIQNYYVTTTGITP